MGAPINNFLTGCPADCDDVVLYPALPVLQDCTDYEQELSQVSDLYLIPNGAPDIFATWATTPTYVASSIDNTVADNTKAKHLVGIGDVPDPTFEEVAYPKLLVSESNGIYTLNFSYYQLSGGGYDFARLMQCGSTAFKFYYADLAGYVYGKAGGIRPASVKVRFPKGRGNTDKNLANVTITWRADGDPDRRPNPVP